MQSKEFNTYVKLFWEHIASKLLDKSPTPFPSIHQYYLLMDRDQYKEVSTNLIIELICFYAHVKNLSVSVAYSEIRNLSESVLVKKEKEYALGNRFYNFEQASLLTKGFYSPVQCAYSFGLKHLVSVLDIANEYLSDKYIDEKLIDLVNYIIIVKNMMDYYSKSTNF